MPRARYVTTDHFDSAIRELEARLTREIGGAVSHFANVVMEQMRTLVAAVDDKYAHLPAQLESLRRDFDEHRADPRLHRKSR